jgi:flagellar hook protein FlgE
MALGSFSAGLSGLNAFSSWLGVIGNNLANMNTIGYKSSGVSFQDLVSQTMSGSGNNPTQVGLGVALGQISPIFSQGAIESTRESTNAAIQGGGFFVVNGSAGESYTRAGNFSFDSNGVLVTTDGSRVQGWTATDPVTGAILATGPTSDITVTPGALRAPVATTQFSTLSNLNSGAAVGNTFTTSVQMYDSLGQSHVMSVTYTKAATVSPAAANWSVRVEVPGADVTGGTVGTPFSVLAGSLSFDATGRMSSFTPTSPATGGGTGATMADVAFATPIWRNGAAASSLSWDIVNAAGTPSITGYAAASATSSISQNGGAAGMLDNVSIAADGTIYASFGSGQSVAVGQLALANFNNPKGLMKQGSNLYSASQAAGIASVGTAGTGGRGSLIGSAIEGSNVDIAQEFTSMILAQRGYQANSKSITVSDELLQETLNLKR